MVLTFRLAVPAHLKQRYHLLPAITKLPTLHLLLQHPRYKDKPTLIFVNKTYTAELLRRTLRLLSHRVTSLHSQLPQQERQNSLARFRAEAAKILIATDLASRGLDIPVVSLVINFDLPQAPDDYIHRVGRTARAGRGGQAISFVTERDVVVFQAVEERVFGEGVQMDKLGDGEGVEEKEVVVALKEVGEARRMAVMMLDEEGWQHNKKRKRGI